MTRQEGRKNIKKEIDGGKAEIADWVTGRKLTDMGKREKDKIRSIKGNTRKLWKKRLYFFRAIQIALTHWNNFTFKSLFFSLEWNIVKSRNRLKAKNIE